MNCFVIGKIGTKQQITIYFVFYSPIMVGNDEEDFCTESAVQPFGVALEDGTGLLLYSHVITRTNGSRRGYTQT